MHLWRPERDRKKLKENGLKSILLFVVMKEDERRKKRKKSKKAV